VVALLVLAGMSAWIRRDLQAGARAERDLRRVSERFNLALAAAQVGTWSWDTGANAVLWDDYIHPLFGLAPGSFGGRYEDFVALIHPDDRAELGDAVARALAGESDFDTEYRVVWGDGSVHVIAARGEVYRKADGAPARMTGVCWDITDEYEARANLRRLKEEADAANEAKSEFLTSMSHELRTPLNSIIGFSQLMLRTSKSRLDPDDRDALVTVQRNAHQLLALINQVLDLARIEAGAVMLSTTRVDLAALAREVVTDVRPLIGTRPLQLGIETPDAPLVVDGDPMRLRQILTNLIANAVKYTAEGTVTVRVTDVYDREVGAAATVSVRDTGPGISEADQARLFERFVRLDTEATRRESGTGLGLSVSQQLAHMHGGRIAVLSDGRTGSEFVLTLPAVGVCEVAGEATRQAG
jgi:PAS domain S-box-containing protein